MSVSHGRRAGQPKGSPASVSCVQVNLAETILRDIKEKIIQRGGSASISILTKRFMIMDRHNDQNQRLDLYELHVGLKHIGIDLNKQGCQLLLTALDTNGSGDVCLGEFLHALKGKMPQRRKDITLEAWKVLAGRYVIESEKNKTFTNRSVLVRDMANAMDFSFDPDVKAGTKSIQQAKETFQSIFDIDKNGVVVFSEFLDYYSNVSATIEDDNYYELMMRNAWHISGGEGAAANTSCKRVLVEFKDRDPEVIEIKNDFGLNFNDPRAVKAHLYKQGVHGIAKVKLFGAMEM